MRFIFYTYFVLQTLISITGVVAVRNLARMNRIEQKPTTPCVEFDHVTVHAGCPTTCRMVWCQKPHTEIASTTGNTSVLWCTRTQSALGIQFDSPAKDCTKE